MKEIPLPESIREQMPEGGLSPAFQGGIAGFIGFTKEELTAVRNKGRAIASVIEGAQKGVWPKLDAVAQISEIIFDSTEHYYHFPPKGDFKLVP